MVHYELTKETEIVGVYKRTVLKV